MKPFSCITVVKTRSFSTSTEHKAIFRIKFCTKGQWLSPLKSAAKSGWCQKERRGESHGYASLNGQTSEHSSCVAQQGRQMILCLSCPTAPSQAQKLPSPLPGRTPGSCRLPLVHHGADSAAAPFSPRSSLLCPLPMPMEQQDSRTLSSYSAQPHRGIYSSKTVNKERIEESEDAQNVTTLLTQRLPMKAVQREDCKSKAFPIACCATKTEHPRAERKGEYRDPFSCQKCPPQQQRAEAFRFRPRSSQHRFSKTHGLRQPHFARQLPPFLRRSELTGPVSNRSPPGSALLSGKGPPDRARGTRQQPPSSTPPPLSPANKGGAGPQQPPPAPPSAPSFPAPPLAGPARPRTAFSVPARPSPAAAAARQGAAGRAGCLPGGLARMCYPDS